MIEKSEVAFDKQYFLNVFPVFPVNFVNGSFKWRVELS